MATHPDGGQDRYVTFADDGSLVARQGVQILEQRHPVELKNFIGRPATARPPLCSRTWTARSSTCWSATSTASRSSTWDYASGGADLDAFLAVARTAYESGEGGR